MMMGAEGMGGMGRLHRGKLGRNKLCVYGYINPPTRLPHRYIHFGSRVIITGARFYAACAFSRIIVRFLAGRRRIFAIRRAIKGAKSYGNLIVISLRRGFGRAVVGFLRRRFYAAHVSRGDFRYISFRGERE